MNSNNTNQLETELRKAGASHDEAAQLAQLGAALHELPHPAQIHHSSELKRELARQIIATSNEPKRWMPWMTAVGFSAALIGGIFVTSVARSSYPGDLTYSLKRASEQITVAVQPAYRDQMMMRRSDEVRHLVETHADSKLVAVTIDSYIYDVGRTSPESLPCARVLHQSTPRCSG